MGKSIRGAMLLALFLGLTSQSMAGNDEDRDRDRDQTRALKGVYRGVAETHCMESQGGFTPNLLFQLNGFAGKYTDTSISTAVFAGDGTMTESVRGTTYFQQEALVPGNLGAGTFVTTCRYTVNVKANKSISMKGSCNGTIPLGPAIGQGVIVDGISKQGQLSEDGSVIIFGSAEPNRDTLTLSSGYVAQRLCGGSATYIRVRQ